MIFRLTQSRRLGCKTVQKVRLSKKPLHGCISSINCFPVDLVQLYTASIPSFGWVKIPQQRCRPAEELSHFSSAWFTQKNKSKRRILCWGCLQVIYLSNIRSFHLHSHTHCCLSDTPSLSPLCYLNKRTAPWERRDPFLIWLSRKPADTSACPSVSWRRWSSSIAQPSLSSVHLHSAAAWPAARLVQTASACTRENSARCICTSSARVTQLLISPDVGLSSSVFFNDAALIGSNASAWREW